MQFQPKSIEEINKEKAAQGVWPVGEYSFEVLDRASMGQNGRELMTCERVSSNGNDMIQLVLSVEHPTGVKRTIPDWILPDHTKFFDACKATGLESNYRSGNVSASDFVSKRGKVKLGIERDQDGQYPDKNKVSGYVIEGSLESQVSNDGGQPPAGHPAHPDNFPNDDVPF